MARGVRRQIINEIEEDAVDEVMQEDRSRTADDLSAALDTLSSFTDSNTKFIVFRIPRGVGKWEWCFEILPPFDSAALMERLKDEFGSGDYAIRVYVDSKIKTTRHFSIAADRKPATSVQQQGDFSAKDFIGLMMTTMQNNAQSQQAASDRQMQMMVAMMNQSQQSMATMITALMGAREKPADLIAAFSPLLAKTEQKQGFGEFVEVLKAARELTGGGDNSGDWTDKLIDGATKTLPVLAEAFAHRGQQAQAASQAIVIPDPSHQVTHQPQANPASRFPVLAMIREDVLFYFTRGMEPEFAAEGIFGTLEKAGIGEADIAPMVIAFSASPDWLTDVAAEGIDLRSNPVWATRFLNELIALYRGEPDDRGGQEGRTTDVAVNGASVPVGEPTDGSAQQSGGTQ